jgi:hypothetical protein
MQMIEGSITVTFEPPYWVGIAERQDDVVIPPRGSSTGQSRMMKRSCAALVWNSAQAIKAERDRLAEDRRKQEKVEPEADEERKFLLRQKKNKEKRKGH